MVEPSKCIIFLRHGEKAYNNGKSTTYPLDPPLTNKGKKKAHKIIWNLIDIYGYPTRIVTSPYLRARQTAQILQTITEKITGYRPPITRDRYIGEYINPYHDVSDVNNCFRGVTRRCGLIVGETWEELNQRVMIYATNLPNVSNGIWFITHGAFIKCLASIFSVHMDKIDYVHGLLIKGLQITAI